MAISTFRFRRARSAAGDHHIIRLLPELDVGNTQLMSAMAADLDRLKKPRREVPNWMAERLCQFQGEILEASGEPLLANADTIDEAFGDDDDFRWVSDFIEFAKKPPRQRAQRRVHLRLKLLYVALYIEFCILKPRMRIASALFGQEDDRTNLLHIVYRTVRDAFGSLSMTASIHAYRTSPTVELKLLLHERWTRPSDDSEASAFSQKP